MASPNPTPPPIRAALFDMDGLLIDSEDLYTIVTNQILAQYSKGPLPWSIKAQLQGRPAPQASAVFHAWAQLPCSDAEYRDQVSALQRDLFPTCKPLPGTMELLRGLKERGVEIALATSSTSTNYKLKTGHLGEMFGLFAPRQRVLGDDERIEKGRGKPLPDIYVLALETINEELREKGEKEITREECLVFEDSVPGVEAGRRAGMQVVWCPHPGLAQEYEGKEAQVLAGAMGEHRDTVGKEKRDGRPGVEGDQWAVQLETLERFPYDRFGIGASKASSL